MTPPDDLVQPFQIDGANLRGRLVRLGPAIDTILTRHAYPPPVSALLGEALTLTAGLAAALKFDGVFTLQTKGDGPVSMLVADYRTPGRLRGYAAWDEAALESRGRVSAPVPRLLGSGYLAFTVDQGDDTERYQGIVELAGATLADCAHNYFQQSEQVDAGIRLAVRHVADDQGNRRWRGGALMLQRLPAEGSSERSEAEEDAWRRALLLIGTASDDELVDPGLTPDRLLYRLFHEDGVRVFTPQPLAAACRCSRERVETVLRSFPPEQVAHMAVEGRITVTCEFCNAVYELQAAELAEGPGH